jgi:hypothetical protein
MTYINTVRPSGTRCYGSTSLATTIKFFTILNDKSNLSRPSAHTKAILRKNGGLSRQGLIMRRPGEYQSYNHGEDHLPSPEYLRQGRRDQPIETADD